MKQPLRTSSEAALRRTIHIRLARSPLRLRMLPRLLSTVRPVSLVVRSAVVSSPFPHLSVRSMSTSGNESVWAEKMPKPAEEMSTFLAVLPDLPDSKR